jgi:hypothetical protein
LGPQTLQTKSSLKVELDYTPDARQQRFLPVNNLLVQKPKRTSNSLAPVKFAPKNEIKTPSFEQ